MVSYDSSYDALFNPGAANDHFSQLPTDSLQPGKGGFLAANAVWLAELCRFTYRLDDELKKANRISDESHGMLANRNLRIAAIISDAATSSRAVLFEQTSVIGSQKRSVQILVFCGSNELLDWKMNVQVTQENWPGGGQVHAGFAKCYTSLAERLASLPFDGMKFWITGHSLGGALATLALADFSSKEIPVGDCYSFGCPRIGDEEFTRLFVSLPLYRVVNNCDVVTAIPRGLGAIEYVHADAAVFLDSDGELHARVSDDRILGRQLAYLPALRKYAEPSVLFKRIKTIPEALPRYLSDHSIINYSARLRAQLDT